MSTHDNLVRAAACLLDTGGETAVTLRAVSHAARLSHNAPYKHFRNRAALLAAVAAADLEWLTITFVNIRKDVNFPIARLSAVIDVLIAFSREHPSRYRLVFGVPVMEGDHPDLQAQNAACVAEVTAIVDECKADKLLPDVPTKHLASLLLAALHGHVLLDANGQLKPDKGLPSIEDNMSLLVGILSRHSGE